MDINKIFDGSLDEIANNIFNETKNTTDKAKAIQQQKIAENVQYVIDALKKIETDLRGEYSDVADKLYERILSIKDGKDGRNGADGRDGKDGRPGRDGLVGAKGADGLPGRDGIDGVDGVSVTDASIDFDGSLIINLSNGRVINVGEVVSQDLADKIQVISTMSTNTAVAAITGGTIDGTVIGGTTPAAGAFTTLASTGNYTITKAEPTIVLSNTGQDSWLIAAGGGGNISNGYLGFRNTTDGVTPFQIAPDAIANTAILSSTGLAVTGTISATGAVTFPAGTALLPSITTTGDTNTGIYFPAADTVGITTGGSERMRIDSSGNVGIGTTSPGTALTLGTTNPVLSFYQPDNTYSLSRSSTEMILNSANATTVTSLNVTALEVRNGYLQFKTGAGAGTSEWMRINSSGILLIGTTSATGSNLLQVNSDALVNTLTVGRGPGNLQTNAVIGYQALNSGTASTGSNVAIGYQALFTAAAAGADRQVAIGYQALYSNNDSTGAVNVGIGYLAGKAATGKSNLFIGGYCSYLRTTGDGNTFVGGSSGTNFSSVPTGSNNTALGSSTLSSLTTGFSNVAVGASAGNLVATGSCNVFVGEVAGANSTGISNVFIGGGNSNGGRSAGQAQTSGDYNTYIGSAAGSSVTTGNYNVVIGGYTGSTAPISTTGSNYVVLSDGVGNIVASSKTAQTFALQGGTLSAGTGIAFPATQSASANANTLDDYEEGTWTPNQGAGLTVVGAFSSVGNYVKIGRVVTVQGTLTGATSIAVSAGGNILTSNLPFSCNTNQTPAYAGNGSSTAFAGTYVNLLTIISIETISATTNIHFFATYYTTT